MFSTLTGLDQSRRICFAKVYFWPIFISLIYYLFLIDFWVKLQADYLGAFRILFKINIPEVFILFLWKLDPMLLNYFVFLYYSEKDGTIHWATVRSNCSMRRDGVSWLAIRSVRLQPADTCCVHALSTLVIHCCWYTVDESNCHAMFSLIKPAMTQTESWSFVIADHACCMDDATVLALWYMICGRDRSTRARYSAALCSHCCLAAPPLSTCAICTSCGPPACSQCASPVVQVSFKLTPSSPLCVRARGRAGFGCFGETGT